MSVHKSVKSLKHDGILIMLLDLIVLLASVEQNRGFLFTASTLNSIVLDFIVYMIINVWWAMNSKDGLQIGSAENLSGYIYFRKLHYYL